MRGSKHHWRYSVFVAVLLSIAALLSIANIILVWGFRFLPLYDYPIWLYEVKVLHALGQGIPPYAEVFDVVKAPVPNLGFVGLVWAISSLVTTEVAGKVALSICVVALPWTWWWSARRIAGRASSWAFLGFPYALNLFFWGRSAYLLGLIVLLVAFGIFLPAHRDIRTRAIACLSLVTLLIFLMHGVIFVVWSVVLTCLLLRNDRGPGRKVLHMCVVFLPASFCAIWSASSAPAIASPGGVSFGMGTISRALLKPLMPFIKTYGVPVLGPISAYNILWLALLFVCLLFFMKKLNLRAFSEVPWLAWVGMILGAGVMLPDPFLNVVQPGGYFVFPAMFLVSVSVRQRQPILPIPIALVGVALCVTGYSMINVARVDRQMHDFFADFRSTYEPSLPFITVGFDWPAGSNAYDAVSPSVNPLFGVPYYVLIEQNGIATIHETSLLRLSKRYAWLRPTTSGATRLEFQESVQQHLPSCMRFPQVIVTGENESSRAITGSFVNSGYRVVRRGAFWTILKRDLRAP